MIWLADLLLMTCSAAGLIGATQAAMKYVITRRQDAALDSLESYGFICGRPGTLPDGHGLGHCHIDETQQEPSHRAPSGRAVCCEQALVCWPHPCPWHPEDP